MKMGNNMNVSVYFTCFSTISSRQIFYQKEGLLFSCDLYKTVERAKSPAKILKQENFSFAVIRGYKI